MVHIVRPSPVIRSHYGLSTVLFGIANLNTCCRQRVVIREQTREVAMHLFTEDLWGETINLFFCSLVNIEELAQVAKPAIQRGSA